MQNNSIICTTGFTFEGHSITAYKGMVRGLVVRSPSISQGFCGAIALKLGGSISAYKSMCEKARLDAYNEMLENARSAGANAIIGLRYDSSALAGKEGESATEVLCYGTGVTIKATGADVSMESAGAVRAVSANNGQQIAAPEFKQASRGPLIDLTMPEQTPAPAKVITNKWEMPNRS